MKRHLLLAIYLLAALTAPPVAAQEDVDAGKRLFRACQGCHSIVPERHMTGPSLAGIFGRKAGSVASFKRYSPAMRQSGVIWAEDTLEKFLADPQSMIHGNWMTFPGIEDAKDRAALIAYLRVTSQMPAPGPARPLLPSLKSLEARVQVTTLRQCGDTYFVTTGDGVTKPFWEFNIRFKTNSTPEGPELGKPAILRAGMMGDRATIVFASPAEISRFIEVKCE
jgi:cytochrome c